MPRTRRKAKHALLLPLRKPSPRHCGPEENPALLAIWDVVAGIPRGQVTTYGEVARIAGLPGRARQVGYALKHAPDTLRLPWHRVVGAGGKISFPPRSRQHREQIRLLRAEGILATNGRIAGELQSSPDNT